MVLIYATCLVNVLCIGMFCIYLVFVVIAHFLKHQFTINEYFYLLPLLIFQSCVCPLLIAAFTAE